MSPMDASLSQAIAGINNAAGGRSGRSVCKCVCFFGMKVGHGQDFGHERAHLEASASSSHPLIKKRSYEC
jgi:hypothetical protein